MMLSVKNLGKIFRLGEQKLAALANVNFEVEQGEFFSIIGPSGCGKSTLLRLIAGLEKPSSGEVIWKIKPVIGFVFQNYALFPYLTVWQNIEFGLKMTGLPVANRNPVCQELIKEMGLSGFDDKHPKELSGGMKQRVGIARALAINPNILLLDEPFSSLDEITANNLRKLLQAIWAKRHMTVILITHLIREAVELSDRIALMSVGPGHIKSISSNIMPRPRIPRSAESYALEDKLSSQFEN